MAPELPVERTLPALLHESLTQRIIDTFREVHSELGSGFAESVYSRALERAFRDNGLRVQREIPIEVFFRGNRVGFFRGDHLVEETILIELKAGERLDPSAEAQLLNCLRATRFEVGLILHFGTKPRAKRLIFTNDRKSAR